MLSRLLLNETSQGHQDEAKAYVEAARKSAGPWTYGLLPRPSASYTVPAGFTSRGQDPKFPHGTVSYQELLPLDTQEYFGLVLIPTQEQEGLIATDLLVTVLCEHREGLQELRDGLFEDPDYSIQTLQELNETLARERWGSLESQPSTWLAHRLLPN